VLRRLDGPVQLLPGRQPEALAPEAKFEAVVDVPIDWRGEALPEKLDAAGGGAHTSHQAASHTAAQNIMASQGNSGTVMLVAFPSRQAASSPVTATANPCLFPGVQRPALSI